MAPLVLAFVLAPLLEQSLRQSMVMSPDGAMIFLQRPFRSLSALLAHRSLLVADALLGRRQARALPLGETT